MSRVEVLSSDSEDDDLPPLEAMVAPKKTASAKPSPPPGPVGPPKPPPGVKLKRVGKKKSTVSQAAVKQAAMAPPQPSRDREAQPPPAVDDSSSEDDSDDLPPPLEPMPFVAKKKLKPVDTSKYPKLTGSKAAPALPPPAVDSDDESDEPVIGPPRPPSSNKKDDLIAESRAKQEKHGRPDYLERDLSEFPLLSMSKLPEGPSANPDVQALQALADEEGPEGRAENFKNSGNECLQHGGPRFWDDAVEYYTRAIQCGSRDYPKVSIYFSNRAAVQVLKKNWGHAVRDCEEALKLDPNNVKAMYRAAKSNYELRKLPEALKFLRMALAKTKTKQLVELERDIARRMRKERLKEDKRSKETELLLEKDLQLRDTLKERGYRFTTDDVYHAAPRLEANNTAVQVQGEGADLEVSMPVIIIYPQGRESDFVQEWGEELFIRDLVEMLFKQTAGLDARREWDETGLYTEDHVGEMCVYVKTNDRFNTFDKQEWVRIKLSNTLQEACTCHPNYVIPVVPVFFVFHASWKETFFGKEMQEAWGAPAQK